MSTGVKVEVALLEDVAFGDSRKKTLTGAK